MYRDHLSDVTENTQPVIAFDDGKFNNSKFKDSAYRNIVKYRVNNPNVLIRVSDNELMLRRKSQPLVGIEFVGIVESEHE